MKNVKSKNLMEIQGRTKMQTAVKVALKMWFFDSDM